MIFIVVKFTVRPEHSGHWLERVGAFTAATRAEPGNLWFEWSASVEDPHDFVLVEAFSDGAAEAHVGSSHFSEAMETMRPMLTRTPAIISTTIPGTGWSSMGELSI